MPLQTSKNSCAIHSNTCNGFSDRCQDNQGIMGAYTAISHSNIDFLGEKVQQLGEIFTPKNEIKKYSNY